MTIDRAMKRHGARRRGGHGLLAMLAVSMLAAIGTDAARAADGPPSPGRVPRPVIETADGTACVADPVFMRKNHMDLLKHQRDDTMHQGIRAPKFSLNGCITCHASKKTNSVVAGADNFCQSCHLYAGVTLDCFDCHSGTPRTASPSAGSAGVPGGGKQ